MLRILRKIIELPLPAHAALALISVIWVQWVKVKLDAGYAASQHPVDYLTGQTSFSGETVKSYYAAMSDLGTLDIYVRTQLIDFAFILGILGFGLFICTLVARLCRAGSFGQKIGLFAGLSFVVGAACDAIENGWSFVMLANPSTFPDWLAVLYSTFAVLKFGFITLGLGLLITCLILAGIGRVFRKPSIG